MLRFALLYAQSNLYLAKLSRSVDGIDAIVAQLRALNDSLDGAQRNG